MIVNSPTDSPVLIEKAELHDSNDTPSSPQVQVSPVADPTWNGGFPAGYFLIRSVASGRLLDVEANEIGDGTEVILYPQMEGSLIESLRRPEADNQVFFIDNTGALCSRASGHAIDAENGHLVLRHRRPITHPYPNNYSHPLPHFTYTPTTGEISIAFDPSASPSVTHRTHTTKLKHLLVSVPLRKPPTRNIMDEAVGVLSNVASAVNPFTFIERIATATSLTAASPTALTAPPNSPLVAHHPARSATLSSPGPSPSPGNPTRRLTGTTTFPRSPTRSLTALLHGNPLTLTSAPEAFTHSHLELTDEEVLEEDRGENEEADDSPEPVRRVRILPVRFRLDGETEVEAAGEDGVGPMARARRRWQVIPLRWSKASWTK